MDEISLIFLFFFCLNTETICRGTFGVAKIRLTEILCMRWLYHVVLLKTFCLRVQKSLRMGTPLCV